MDANKAVVRRLYAEVFQAGDLDVADDLVHPDARDFADAQDRRGPQRVKEVATLLRAAVPEQAWEVHDMRAEGDRVVMHSTWRGTHEGTFMGIPPTHAASRPTACTCSVSRRARCRSTGRSGMT